MELQQIIGFYYVAKLGSFTKAASATFRTQSAISQHIRYLEEELGCQLLERIGKRELRLTSGTLIPHSPYITQIQTTRLEWPTWNRIWTA